MRTGGLPSDHQTCPFFVLRVAIRNCDAVSKMDTNCPITGWQRVPQPVFNRRVCRDQKCELSFGTAGSGGYCKPGVTRIIPAQGRNPTHYRRNSGGSLHSQNRECSSKNCEKRHGSRSFGPGTFLFVCV